MNDITPEDLNILELDCRHLNSPMPILLLRRKYAESLPKKHNEIKILLQADIEENKREIELVNKKCEMGYEFNVIKGGVTLTQHNDSEG